MRRFDLYLNRCAPLACEWRRHWWATVFAESPAAALDIAHRNDCLPGPHYFSVYGPILGEPTYRVCLCVGESVVSTWYASNCMAAFRTAFQAVRGVPCAGASVRRAPYAEHCLAWLESDSRGEVTEIEVYPQRGVGQRESLCEVPA